MLKVYLASPYSNLDHEEAYRRALFATKVLLGEGIATFSPIIYGYQMRSLGEGWSFWGKFNESWINWADIIAVYCLPGWKRSVGVREEFTYAQKYEKTVLYYEDVPTMLKGLLECQDS